MRFIAAFPLVTLWASANNIVSYDGCHALRVRSEGDLPAVQSKFSKLSYDEWERTADDITITLSPEQIPAFNSLGLGYDVMHVRDIFGIHFWGDEGPGKPAVFFHGTVHAREWISAPFIEYVTLQLLTGYGNDNQTTVARDSYDLCIFPFANPDVGCQPERRFGYKGEAPGDTPEMAGLHGFIDKLRDANGIKLFIDWHSYSQYLLAPLSWNCTQYIPKLGQHVNLARRATRAIREVEGTQFVFGPSCATLYVATGYSIDYAYEVGKADWAYVIELRDTGNHGFVLPPEQIRGSAEEQWGGIKTILQYLDVEDIFEA
ncbi:zinc carboxypeptidase A [Verticillium alfalfae VaMs.102]|uniref:Zinc carboxypeptidase A n=1 Tax=Verticillium alfalfae (strain VaMs.102 / ATCC MYA-4576 / FGSC 10136) TaxID=526221 RepID=C9SL06_VERA1|nr:zinc carboxypeptidase A [Verticillium alfalfae VaMs.102]EEY19374.1 zinc carboxypeptidase A [Verticillium alfalfae VaMs.102]